MDVLAKLEKAQTEVSADAEVSALLKSSRLHSIAILNRIETEGFETTRFQHYYNGIEVFGSQTFHHTGAAGSVVQNLLAKFDVSTEPQVDSDTAVSIARSMVGARELSGAPELKILPTAGQDQARLVYFIRFASQEDLPGRLMILDAHSGELVANISQEVEIVPVQVFSTLTAFSLQRASGPCQQVTAKGDPVQFNLQACHEVIVNDQPQAGADADAVRALNNTNRVLAYYASNFKRLSYDGQGSQIINIVHAGRRYANAFWDTQNSFMAYGDGDGVQLGDMTLGLDIAGHEMTHGVTSRTANFIAMGEPGALNEANSDFFGKMIAADGTWSIGAAVFLHPRPGANAIRDLQNPARLSSPVSLAGGLQKVLPYPSATTQEAPMLRACTDANDNCNVHYNSTIPSHAMYLMSTVVGTAVAQNIQYAALTHALGPNTSFRQYGQAIRTVCGQLYDARTCAAVSQAYASIGL
jgi:Zn-dependent metalloprotease